MNASVAEGETTASDRATDLVNRIAAGDPLGLERLYEELHRGAGLLLRRYGLPNLEDRLHDVFLIVAGAIQRGELRQPERLWGFVRSVIHNQVAYYVDRVAVRGRLHDGLPENDILVDRQDASPEQLAIKHERMELAMRILRSISERDRAVLVKFYLDEQTPEGICREMGLTANQFRLIKHRAKARFTELAKRSMERRRVCACR